MRISIETPIYLLLVLILPFIVGVILYLRSKHKSKSFVPFSSLVLIDSLTQKEDQKPLMILLVTFCITFITFLLVLSGVKLVNTSQVEAENIVIVMDVSNSMIAQDLIPNRLEVEKKFVVDLLNTISDESTVSLIIFGGSVEVLGRNESKEQIIERINEINLSDLSPRTALGDALVSAYRLINQSNSENKGNIVVITDGETNSGADPVTSVTNLNRESIKVFAIGIGSREDVSLRLRIDDEEEVETIIPPLNTEDLEDITSLTGGIFYRAEDQDRFTDIVESMGSARTTNTTEQIINIDRLFALFSFVGFLAMSLYGVPRYR